MGGQDDFVTALKAIMAATREELGEPPTPEELLAWRDDRLEPAARQRVEAKIAVHPDAARALADLAAFPDVVAAPGTPELDDEEIGARWLAFRERLPAAPARDLTPRAFPGPPGEGSGGSAELRRLQTPHPGPAPPLTSPGPRRPGALRLAAAAVLALAAGAAGFLAGRATRDLPGSAVNVEIAQLPPVDEGGARSAAVEVELPGDAEELVLVLGAPDGEGFPDYQAEVVDEQGARVWARQGLRPTPFGTFNLAFRRGALGPGRYRLHLTGRDGGSTTPVATYELRLVDRPLPPSPGQGESDGRGRPGG